VVESTRRPRRPQRRQTCYETTRTALALLLGIGIPGVFLTAPAQERSQQVGFAERHGPDAARLNIPSGTPIPVTLDEDIPIKRDRMGETFEAHVTRDVVVDGEVAIPAGAPAEVTLVKSDEKGDNATLRLSGVHVRGEMRSVNADVAHADTDQAGMGTGKKTAIGAAAGAVVGAVTGAGVLKGAVVGAGGGLAWGLLSGKDTEVEDGTRVQFSLEKELEVR